MNTRFYRKPSQMNRLYLGPMEKEVMDPIEGERNKDGEVMSQSNLASADSLPSYVYSNRECCEDYNLNLNGGQK